MTRVRASVAGASGYVGGELIRLLARHPFATLAQATSERHAGRPIAERHPNLRRVCLKDFEAIDDLAPSDVRRCITNS